MLSVCNCLIVLLVTVLTEVAIGNAIPLDPPSDLGPVKAIFSDKSQGFCAIDLNDQVRCWGDVNEEFARVPADLVSVESLSLHYGHGCAITKDHQSQCWGWDYGLPASHPWAMAIPDELNRVKLLSSGNSHDCAVDENNKLICWKDGLRVYSPALQFQSISDLSPMISAVCAINEARNVICYNDPDSHVKKVVPPIDKAIKLSVDDWATGCIIKEDRTVLCFGDKNESNQNTPIDLGEVKDLSVGRGSACAVKGSNNLIVCWSTWGHKPSSTVGTPIPEEVVGVATGFMAGCGILKSDRTVKCWNTYEGQLASRYNQTRPRFSQLKP